MIHNQRLTQASRQLRKQCERFLGLLEQAGADFATERETLRTFSSTFCDALEARAKELPALINLAPRWQGPGSRPIIEADAAGEIDWAAQRDTVLGLRFGVTRECVRQIRIHLERPKVAKGTPCSHRPNSVYSRLQRLGAEYVATRTTTELSAELAASGNNVQQALYRLGWPAKVAPCRANSLPTRLRAAGLDYVAQRTSVELASEFNTSVAQIITTLRRVNYQYKRVRRPYIRKPR